MWHIPLPDGESHFLLSPRWPELAAPLQWGLLALVGLMPALLVVWLYRRELRTLSRWKAAGLLALRLAVVAGIWVLLALQPVLVHTGTEEVPGYVLVAVDRSASMEFADPQRPRSGKIALAHALNLQASDDDARCAAVDRLTRSEVARRVLGADGLRLLERLREKHHVHLIAFDKDTWDVGLDALDELSKPGGAATNLRAPLAQALQRSATQPRRALGVVLLTDGRHTWGEPPGDLARALGGRGVPVLSVALGARRPPPDVALVEVQAPANAFKDVDAEVRARVRVSGLPAQELVVELLQDGKVESVEHVQRLAHDGGDRTYTVTFPIRLEKVGVVPLQVKVGGSGAGPAEVTRVNNQRTVTVRVTEDRAKVLLIHGEAGWEHQYLANALGRDPGVKLDRVVFEQPRIGLIEEADLKKAGHAWLTLPPLLDDKQAPDPLLAYDCIILGDAEPEHLSFAERRRLEKYVADRGGTLVLAAGKRSLPLGLLQREQQAGDEDPLLKLLPIEQAHVVAPEKGFTFTPTAAGKETPFLQLDAERGASAQRWAELPKHFWAVVGKPGPGATVLARAVGEKSEAAEENGLLVEQKYGFGRVVYLGLDSTWRWRYKVAEKYQHRFWGQLVRWAAAEQLLPAGNDFVRYGSRAAVYRQDQEVPVQLRLLDDAARPAPGAFVGLRLFRQDGGKETAVALLELRRNEKQQQTFAGAARPLPPGTYRLEPVVPDFQERVAAPAKGEADGARHGDTFTVLAADADELADLGADWEQLRQLAGVSGGEVFTPETAAELVERLTRAVETRQVRHEQALWQDAPLVWVVLGLLVGLLTLEWVGRKRAGLP
jgi:hypothetical protein